MKIISVGGSIIIPQTGFDIPFLKKFRSLILRQVEKGERFILVVGGGATCRYYQDAAKKVVNLTDEELDWIGINATIYNSQFVRMLFGDLAHSEVITNPNKKIKTDRPIIMAAGWQPGCSSDNDAVLLAKTYGVKEILNLSNIEYVYDKDPKKFKNAIRIEQIDWKSFRRDIVGYDWKPGKNAPFDPTASGEAEKLGLKVAIVKGTDLKEVDKAIKGEKFRGTLIG